MKKMKEYELVNVELTHSAVCEKIATVLIKHKSYPTNAVADIAYKIAEALGWK